MGCNVNRNRLKSNDKSNLMEIFMKVLWYKMMTTVGRYMEVVQLHKLTVHNYDVK